MVVGYREEGFDVPLNEDIIMNNKEGNGPHLKYNDYHYGKINLIPNRNVEIRGCGSVLFSAQNPLFKNLFQDEVISDIKLSESLCLLD